MQQDESTENGICLCIQYSVQNVLSILAYRTWEEVFAVVHYLSQLETVVSPVGNFALHPVNSKG
jgi:hypothetical protein